MSTHSVSALINESVMFFPLVSSFTSKMSDLGIKAVTFMAEYTIAYRIKVPINALLSGKLRA